ncbi:MAG: hypothetical protein WCR72_07440 [Bacteroidota bacterium]
MIETNYIINCEVQREPTITGFGNPENYIKSISLPKELRVGEEFFTRIKSIVVIQRKTNPIIEIFKKPFFCITKQIRIQFHWEGIHVVGSYMEEPNKFLLPIPSHKGEYNWFFKIISTGDAVPGFKPLYISIDTFHENVFLKWMLKMFKIISLLALIGIILIGSFYRNSVIGEKIFFGELLKDTTLIVRGLSPFFIFLILLVAYWKNISETFESFYKKENRELDMNKSYDGTKVISETYGIEIRKNP